MCFLLTLALTNVLSTSWESGDKVKAFQITAEALTQIHNED